MCSLKDLVNRTLFNQCLKHNNLLLEVIQEEVVEENSLMVADLAEEYVVTCNAKCAPNMDVMRPYAIIGVTLSMLLY